MTNRTAQTLVVPLPLHVRLRAHLAISRLDHSIKHIFVVPGILIPLSILRVPFTRGLAKNIVVGFIAVTLIACSNYVVNEVLDAPFDRLHPKKKSRPVAQGLVNVPIAYVQWIVMMIAGLALS
jgi:decaprenyl-phosphate phosphoribosyltransferase